ncbi:MAG: diphosphomevalonate decarboxylase, partial [Curtobacterium sp.]
MTTATAVAHPNIALVKYWGKADATLALPATGSVSMGLDVFPTTTTVTVGDTADDTLTLNGAVTTDGALVRVTQFLDLVRE